MAAVNTYEDIDSLMGCSDKVQPNFVRQTTIMGDDQDLLISDEDKVALCSGSKQGMGPDDQERPAPHKQSRNTRVDEFSLLAILDAQHSAIKTVEENDR